MLSLSQRISFLSKALSFRFTLLRFNLLSFTTMRARTVQWQFSFMCSWNWGKFDTVDKKVLNLHKKWILQHHFSCCFLLHDLFPFEYLFINISLMQLDENETSNRKYLLEFIKRRSKAYQKNMPCESTLKFGQWKRFSKTYKPMRVWLRLVYKIT